MKLITIFCLTCLLVLSGCSTRPAAQQAGNNSINSSVTTQDNSPPAPSVDSKTMPPVTAQVSNSEVSAAQTPSPLSAASITVEVLLAGSNGKRVEASTIYIEGQSDLLRLWRQLTGNASVPSIDFSSHCVVTIFMGQRNTGGFSYQVGEASYLPSGVIQLEVFELRPKRNSVVAQALTSPFIMLMLPKGTGQPSVRISVK